MKKEVLLSIRGMHTDMLLNNGEEEDEAIEVLVPAVYFFKNGKHYILYDEVAEGMQGVTKNKIKINGEQSLEIMKTGIVNAHMVFEKDKQMQTCYGTPYGQMLVSTYTTGLDLKESEDEIAMKVEYELTVNYQPVAECEIFMKVIPRGKCEK